MRKRFAIVIGVAAAGVMALGAQSAAAVVKHETKLTITQEGPQPPITLIHGDVQSGFKNCEAHRKVVLFKKRAGADRKLGTVLSGGGDSWGIEVHGATQAWHVYAKVTRKVLPGGGGICRRDRSRTKRVLGF